jgi:hypothetical protein
MGVQSNVENQRRANSVAYAWHSRLRPVRCIDGLDSMAKKLIEQSSARLAFLPKIEAVDQPEALFRGMPKLNFQYGPDLPGIKISSGLEPFERAFKKLSKIPENNMFIVPREERVRQVEPSELHPAQRSFTKVNICHAVWFKLLMVEGDIRKRGFAKFSSEATMGKAASVEVDLFQIGIFKTASIENRGNVFGAAKVRFRELRIFENVVSLLDQTAERRITQVGLSKTAALKSASPNPQIDKAGKIETASFEFAVEKSQVLKTLVREISAIKLLIPQLHAVHRPNSIAGQKLGGRHMLSNVVVSGENSVRSTTMLDAFGELFWMPAFRCNFG